MCYPGSMKGFLIYNDELPRTIQKSETGRSPTKRKKTSGDDTDIALDLLLLDRTGPTMVCLWKEAVKEFLELLPHVGQAQGKPIVHLGAMRIGELAKGSWNGTLLTPIKMLHSTSATAYGQGTRASFLSERAKEK